MFSPLRADQFAIYADIIGCSEFVHQLLNVGSYGTTVKFYS
jgi:hypothetical protein